MEIVAVLLLVFLILSFRQVRKEETAASEKVRELEEKMTTSLANLGGKMDSIQNLYPQLSQSQHQVMSDLQLQVGERVKEIRERVESLNQSLLASQSGLSKEMTETLGQKSETIVGELNRLLQTVTEQLGSVKKEGARMSQIAPIIADLQKALAGPARRGKFGETLLTKILEDKLPKDAFELQVELGRGKVDALIKLGEHKVPVDAKFPLEGFERLIPTQGEEEIKRARREFGKDVKKHVDDIAFKYIEPSQETVNFALMYIPSDSVFYEIASDNEILDYAAEKKVYPVSPNTFYVYLETILRGLRGMRLEKDAKRAMASLQQITGDLARLNEPMETLGKQLSWAQSNYDEVRRLLEDFRRRIESLTAD